MEPPSRTAIQIHNQTARRLPRALITRAVFTTLAAHERDHESVAVAIVDDPTIREWNRRYRGFDAPTDVLSFDSSDVPGAPLGDIAISADYAERQAIKRRGSLASELAYLAIHGTLHLLGFDDEDEISKAAMMSEMHRVGALVGLPAERFWTSILDAEAV